jgi:hypothetical protein
MPVKTSQDFDSECTVIEVCLLFGRAGREIRIHAFGGATGGVARRGASAQNLLRECVA